jgi:hypothetical protein
LHKYPRIKFKRITAIRYTKIYNGNDPFAYFEDDVVLCPDCTKSFEKWLRAVQQPQEV